MRVSQGAGGRPEPFIEYHYYKGGLRTDFIGGEHTRPEWAAPADWVGFRDEVPLEANDLVIEVAKFSRNDITVSWIGLYRLSVDEVYGNRRNHAGVGVWLPGKYPSDPASLVDGLTKLLRVFVTAENSVFVHHAKAVLNDFLGHWLSDYTELPHPLSGLESAKTMVLRHSIYMIDREADDEKKSLENLVYRLFFLSQDEVKKDHRAIILLCDKRTIEALSAKGLRTYGRDRFTAEMLTRLPTAFESQSLKNLELSSELSRAQGETRSLLLRSNQLNTDLAAVRTSEAELKRQCDALSNLLSSKDAHRRHAVLLEEFAKTNYKLDKISQELPGMLTALRSELRSVLSRNLSHPKSPPPKYVERVRNEKPDTESRYDWTAISIAFVCACILLALAAYLLFWFLG